MVSGLESPTLVTSDECLVSGLGSPTLVTSDECLVSGLGSPPLVTSNECLVSGLESPTLVTSDECLVSGLESPTLVTSPQCTQCLVHVVGVPQLCLHATHCVCLSPSVVRWYHGGISRCEAESVLVDKADFSFLVRNSESCRTDFSLSIR